MTIVIDFIMLHNRCVSLKNIFVLLTYRLISASMLLICWYEAYADFIFMGIKDSHHGLCSRIAPSRLPCPIPSRGQGLGHTMQGSKRQLTGCFSYIAEEIAEGHRTLPRKWWRRTGILVCLNPVPQDFPTTMHYFWMRVPALNRSVCCSYVHQIIMLWGSTLRAIGPSSKGIQKGKNEIMHLNWVRPYNNKKI